MILLKSLKILQTFQGLHQCLLNICSVFSVFFLQTTTFIFSAVVNSCLKLVTQLILFMATPLKLSSTHILLQSHPEFEYKLQCGKLFSLKTHPSLLYIPFVQHCFRMLPLGTMTLHLYYNQLHLYIF